MSFSHFFSTGPASSQGRASLLLRWLAVSLASVALIAALACGSDNAASDDDSTPKPGATVDGDTLRWSPPWKAGDRREVTVTSSYEFSPELEALIEEYAALFQEFEDPMYGGTGGFDDLLGAREPQSFNGTVRFLNAGSGGALAEYEIDFSQVFEALLSEMGAAGIPESEMGMFNAVVNLLSQLGLSLELDIAPDGELTGVANLRETAESLRGFIGALSALAGTQGDTEEFMDAETLALIDKAFVELPDTELAKQLALAGVNGATGNLFLMRQGEYSVGEPVAVEGQVPSFIGLPVPGVATYSLTAVSDTQATLEVQVTAQPMDIEALALQYATELAEIFGEDVDVAAVTAAFAEMTAEDRQMLDAVVAMLFQPYTVTLTLDTVTGWVTGAEWEAEFSMPDELIADLQDAPEGLQDFSVTMAFKSTIE